MPGSHSGFSLLLASRSPRRARLLALAGFRFEVRVPPPVEREPAPGQDPAEFVARNARAKAQAVARRESGRWVLGADTVVVVGGDILGKPADPEEAAAMLARLAGRWHEVYTGVCLLGPEGRAAAATDRSRVLLKALDRGAIRAYHAAVPPEDKAGAYDIASHGPLAGGVVARVDGSYTNVMGLPLGVVTLLVARLGPPPRAEPAGRTGG